MKTNNPICPFDKSNCEPNVTGFAEMDGCLDCSNCPRYCNGVRETGGFPLLDEIFSKLKNNRK